MSNSVDLQAGDLPREYTRPEALRRFGPRAYSHEKHAAGASRRLSRQRPKRRLSATRANFKVAASDCRPITSRSSALMDRDVLPTGPWQLRTLVAFAALCAVHGGVRAQLDAPSGGDFAAEQAPPHTPGLEELPAPELQVADEPIPLAEAESTATAAQVPGGVGNADIR